MAAGDSTPGRGLFTASIAVLLTVGGFTALAIDAVRYRDAERIETCERAVSNRADARAMWLVTFDEFPGEVVVDRLRDELDELLPPLRCVGATPTPEETHD